MNIPKEHKLVAALQFITVAGVIGCWLAFYFFPDAIQTSSGYQFPFDTPFPPLDALLCIGLCLSGVALLKNRKWGRFLSLICGLYLIYLAVIDLGIPIGQTVVAVSIIDIVSNGFVNLWCVVLGMYIILKLRKKAA
jgi:hypothetical protein